MVGKEWLVVESVLWREMDVVSHSIAGTDNLEAGGKAPGCCGGLVQRLQRTARARLPPAPLKASLCDTGAASRHLKCTRLDFWCSSSLSGPIAAALGVNQPTTNLQTSMVKFNVDVLLPPPGSTKPSTDRRKSDLSSFAATRGRMTGPAPEPPYSLAVFIN